jgi:beta-lactamase class A
LACDAARQQQIVKEVWLLKMERLKELFAARRGTVLVITGVVVLLLAVLLPTALSGGRRAAAPTAGAPVNVAEQDIPTQTATTEPTVAPTATAAPSPTPEPFTFPDGSEVADVDVSGLTVEAAQEVVEEALSAYNRTLTVSAAEWSATLEADDYLQLPPADQLVDEAHAEIEGQGPVELPLEMEIDRTALATWVESIAPELGQVAETVVISDAQALTQTFTFARRPGLRLDVDQSVAAIAEALAQPTGDDQIELVMDVSGVDPLPMAELERVLLEHAGYWKGVAGFYVHNLETGETLAYNADTVFSGASVMKVPIMIFAYSRLGELNEQQREWMHKMIIDSENLEANDLLAAAVGGAGTEVALQGVNEMTQMLRDLGLEHTYQLIPYESGEWLILQSMLPAGGPAREGEAPFTSADPYLRTTPREMGRLFVMLDECARGTGPLLEIVGGELNEDVCNEMIDWLQQPHDPDRMVAGLPPGTVVAHKGGWITNMQSDVGIVESPGGRYVAAIYIWTDGYVTDDYATPSPYLGDFSHTIYTFFNPVPLDEVQQPVAEESE